MRLDKQTNQYYCISLQYPKNGFGLDKKTDNANMYLSYVRFML